MMEDYILARKEYCKQKKLLKKRVFAYIVKTLKKPDTLRSILVGAFILCLTIAVIVINITFFRSDVDMRGVTTSTLIIAIISIADRQRRK